jgi:hypothetical protein
MELLLCSARLPAPWVPWAPTPCELTRSLLCWEPTGSPPRLASISSLLCQASYACHVPALQAHWATDASGPCNLGLPHLCSTGPPLCRGAGEPLHQAPAQQACHRRAPNLHKRHRQSGLDANTRTTNTLVILLFLNQRFIFFFFFFFSSFCLSLSVWHLVCCLNVHHLSHFFLFFFLCILSFSFSFFSLFLGFVSITIITQLILNYT